MVNMSGICWIIFRLSLKGADEIMPRLEIDLLNTELIKDALAILQDLLNDDRLPNDMYLEYGKKFERIWNIKQNGGI